MTPLAQALLNDYALPAHRRRFRAFGCRVDLQKDLLDAHAFEVSAVYPMVPGLTVKMSEVTDGLIRSVKETKFAFLPAPKTWLEWRDEREDDGLRTGILLQEAGEFCLGTLCLGNRSGALGAVGEFVIRFDGKKLSGEGDDMRALSLVPEIQVEKVSMFVLDVFPILAMINTPRVIGRRTHMPHAGLQKKLAASKGMPGKYPLLAWHEILLEVTPPTTDGGGPEEIRLTGSKALHFCRAHLRVRLGRLEVVSAHWRGDPALGMKQTRYRVEPPRTTGGRKDGH